MYYIIKPISTVPSFNLAWEEYILKNIYQGDDIFFLWQNTSSIIIGRNQNVFSEVDLEYLHDNQIPLYRRNSGGGTVYHDLGNINFTFITKSKNKVNNYELMTKEIVKALNNLNINAYFKPKSHLYLYSDKIGGNAQFLYKDILLHHGTILFNSDLEILNQCLLQNDNHISKAIKSAPSSVTNINTYTSLDINSFIDYLYQEVAPNSKVISLNDNDLKEIKRLEESKYLTNKWNYYESPPSTYIFNKDDYKINLNLEKGKIIKALIKYQNQDLTFISSLLIGKSLLPEDLSFLKIEFIDIYNLLIKKR